MRMKTILAATLAAGLLAAGCGGDDEETTTTTTTTTGATGASGASGASGEQGQAAGGGLLEDEFAQDMNDICEAGNEEIDAEAKEVFGDAKPSDADQKAFVADTLIPSIEGQIEDIRDLGEPEEGAEELDTVLADGEDALGELEDDPAILTTKGEDPFAGISGQMKELGVPACAD